MALTRLLKINCLCIDALIQDFKCSPDLYVQVSNSFDLLVPLYFISISRAVCRFLEKEIADWALIGVMFSSDCLVRMPMIILPFLYHNYLTSSFSLRIFLTLFSVTSYSFDVKSYTPHVKFHHVDFAVLKIIYEIIFSTIFSYSIKIQMIFINIFYLLHFWMYVLLMIVSR